MVASLSRLANAEAGSVATTTLPPAPLRVPRGAKTPIWGMHQNRSFRTLDLRGLGQASDHRRMEVAMTHGGRKVQFEEMFPWEVAAAMAEAPLCFLPLGTLEWHGEHAAVGLDALKAHAVCALAAQRSGGLVVPPLFWSTDWREDLPDGSYLTGGIERGERYHVPGSMFWLRLETFHNLLLDFYEAMRRRGFRAIVVLSGHWSIEHNIAAIRDTGEVFLRTHPAMGWLLLTDQEVVPALQRYAVVLDLGLIGCLVQYRGCRGPLLIITEPR